MARGNPNVEGSYEYEPMTKGDGVPSGGPAKWLLVGTAGTANLVDLAGNERTNVPLQEGYNPIGAREVLTGGTADNIWALR